MSNKHRKLGAGRQRAGSLLEAVALVSKLRNGVIEFKGEIIHAMCVQHDQHFAKFASEAGKHAAWRYKEPVLYSVWQAPMFYGSAAANHSDYGYQTRMARACICGVPIGSHKP